MAHRRSNRHAAARSLAGAWRAPSGSTPPPTQRSAVMPSAHARAGSSWNPDASNVNAMRLARPDRSGLRCRMAARHDGPRRWRRRSSVSDQSPPRAASSWRPLAVPGRVTSIVRLARRLRARAHEQAPADACQALRSETSEYHRGRSWDVSVRPIIDRPLRPALEPRLPELALLFVRESRLFHRLQHDAHALTVHLRDRTLKLDGLATNEPCLRGHHVVNIPGSALGTTLLEQRPLPDGAFEGNPGRGPWPISRAGTFTALHGAASALLPRRAATGRRS